MDFDLGNTVEWTSHGSHWNRTKRGKIIAVIPARRVATSKHLLSQLEKHYGKFNRDSLGYGPPRNHVSYLVVCEDENSDKLKIFWPRVKALRRVRG